jgi:signal transduction histidine kinase
VQLVRQRLGNYLLYVEPTEAVPHHISRLFQLAHDLKELPDDCLNIQVDFHYCTFLNHLAVAFLGGLACMVEARGGRMVFAWETLSRRVLMNLAQNGFLSHFGYDQGPWDGNSIPYRRDVEVDSTDIGDYLRYKWLGKGWVNISAELQAIIAGQVEEIYINADDHSQSDIGVFSCGQHYPRMGYLHLTVVDFGIGIPARVRSLPKNATLSSPDALAWAFQEGNTTRSDGIPHGLGLSLLQEFIRQNHGSLTIWSNDAQVSISDNEVKYESCDINFSGTLVDIALLCDERYYCLSSEVPSTGEPLF